MYKKVVVPLDGSKLAEVALPHLEVIAKGCTIPEVLLVSVTERVKGMTSSALSLEEDAAREFHMKPTGGPLPAGTTYSGLVYPVEPRPAAAHADLGRMAKTAWNYLAKISLQLQEKGLNTRAVVLVGNPAEEIVRYAESEGADLIVMASRGKSGFSRWDMGNIADKVIRASTIPVFLVKPPAGFEETKPKRRGKAN